MQRGEVSAYGWLVLLVSSLFSYPFALWPFLSLAVAWVSLAVSLEAGTAEVRWWKRTVVWPVVAVGGWCVWNLSVDTARRVELTGSSAACVASRMWHFWKITVKSMRI